MMPTRITQTERLRAAGLLLKAQELITGVDALEQQLIKTLQVTVGQDRELITDAVSSRMTVDALLDELGIVVEEEAS